MCSLSASVDFASANSEKMMVPNCIHSLFCRLRGRPAVIVPISLTDLSTKALITQMQRVQEGHPEDRLL